MRSFFAGFSLFFFLVGGAAADFSPSERQKIAGMKKISREIFLENLFAAVKKCHKNRECLRGEIRNYFKKRFSKKREMRKFCRQKSAFERKKCRFFVQNSDGHFLTNFGGGLLKTPKNVFLDFREISKVREKLLGKTKFDAKTFGANDFFAWDRDNLYFREKSGVFLVPVFSAPDDRARFRKIFSVGKFRALGRDFLANGRDLFQILDLKKCPGNFDGPTLDVVGDAVIDQKGKYPFSRDISGAKCPIVQ